MNPEVAKARAKLGKDLVERGVGAVEKAVENAELELRQARAALSATRAAAKALADEAAESVPLARSAATRLRDAVEELLEVSALRGDSDLPAPPDDPKLWTARAIDAWAETSEALAAYDEEFGS